MKESIALFLDKEKTLKNCGFVKMGLMFLVILGHCTAFWNGTWFTGNPFYKSSMLGIFSDYLGSFHIYAFTLVSGYIFAFKMSGGGIRGIENLLQIKPKDY